MSKFKLTKGRLQELEICKYFWSEKWKFDNYIHTTQTRKTITLTRDENGATPLEGYFLINERGLKEIKTTDPNTLLRLLWGRIWADRCIHEIWEPSLACQGGEFGLVDLWIKPFPPNAVIEYTAKKICGGQHYEELTKLFCPLTRYAHLVH